MTVLSLCSSLCAGLILVLLFACGISADTIPPTDKLDGFDEFFTQKMADFDVPGAVVGIVENDTVIYLKPKFATNKK